MASSSSPIAVSMAGHVSSAVGELDNFPHKEWVSSKRKDIQEAFETIAKDIKDCDGAAKEAQIVRSIRETLKATVNERLLDYSNWKGILLPEETFWRIMKFLAEPPTYPTGSIVTLEDRELEIVRLLENVLEFRDTIYSAAFLEYALNWLEDHWVIASSKYVEKFLSPSFLQASDLDYTLQARFFNILSKLLPCDKERSQETRILRLFWLHCTRGLHENHPMTWLRDVAKHYSSYPVSSRFLAIGMSPTSSTSEEVGRQEEFIETDEDRVPFLHACSEADTRDTFSTDVRGALNRAEVYGRIVESWAEKEKNLHSMLSSGCELATVPSLDFSKSVRQQTARNCLDRLDFTRNMSSDLNPYKCDTFGSVIDSVTSPELTALHALKEEIELPREVVRQVEEINEKHRRAYEVVKKQQYEALDEMFRACQKEIEGVLKEALYKKVKLFTRIEKASISSAENLSCEEVLKRIVQEAGGALKAASDDGDLRQILDGNSASFFQQIRTTKVEAITVEKMVNGECALCYLKFSKKRKRACLDPCGHTSACISCASKAWEKQPNCPLCRVAIAKPIPLPAQLFF